MFGARGLFGVPGESLLVEVDDELRTLLAGQLRRNEHGLVAVLPLNEESELPLDVSGADDLLRLESVVEWRFGLLFRVSVVLLVGMLGVVVVGFFFLASFAGVGVFLRFLLLWLVLLLFLLFQRLGLVLRLGLTPSFGRLRRFVVLLRAHGGALVGTVAEATLLSRADFSFLCLKREQKS